MKISDKEKIEGMPETDSKREKAGIIQATWLSKIGVSALNATSWIKFRTEVELKCASEMAASLSTYMYQIVRGKSFQA